MQEDGEKSSSEVSIDAVDDIAARNCQAPSAHAALDMLRAKQTCGKNITGCVRLDAFLPPSLPLSIVK